MLKIRDEIYPNDFHEFKLDLKNILFKNNRWYYSLDSPTQPLFHLTFELPRDNATFHDGYSVTIYLLKNKFFAPKDIIEVRVDDYKKDHGRIGYIMQLASIFDPSVLTLDKHTFSYAYYALGNIFYNADFRQTKTPTFQKTVFTISDFFDDDLLLLMTCDQITAQISGFNILHYLPALYSSGFYLFSSTLESEFSNSTVLVQDNYIEVCSHLSVAGTCSFRLHKISVPLLNEDYIQKLFSDLLLKKLDEETRFLMLYQIIELLIAKILTTELMNAVCNNPAPLEGIDLKNYISEETTEKKRLSRLFAQPYTQVSSFLKDILKEKIYVLLQLLNFADSQTAFNPLAEFVGIFYGYRNKLVHSHRYFRANNIDSSRLETLMSEINSLLELLLIEVVTTYR